MSYHILIADDATMNRSLIRDILSKSLPKVEFAEAANGEEVLEIVQFSQVDLIILDLVMPIMDGYEVLRWLKKHPEFHDIPVIVNSAITEIRSIEQTLKEGAVDYFTKPLSPNDMQIILPLKAKNALLLYEQQKTIVALNRQISEELKNANTFANIMLPKEKGFNQVDLFLKYFPSLGIGGDFFDCVELDGKVHFMIADVTGHGIAAGMASSMVKVLYRRIIEKNNILPHEILEEMNQSIFKIFDFAGKDNYFVFTAFVGILEHGTLQYANAGHPYPMIYLAKSDNLVEIKQNGFLVGMLNNVGYATEYYELNQGDIIFLYTDGLFGACEGKDFTGWEKVFLLSRQLSKVIKVNPKEFLDELFYAFHMIHKSNQTNFTDDVAMMLLRVK
ncbi:PP2C family protein-serine/threonine phosphatase [Fusibacter bizertensis]